MKKLIAIALALVCFACEEDPAAAALCIEPPKGEFDPEKINVTFEPAIRNLDSEENALIDSISIKGIGRVDFEGTYSPWVVIPDPGAIDSLVVYSRSGVLDLLWENVPREEGGYVVAVVAENEFFGLTVETASHTIITGTCDDVITY